MLKQIDIKGFQAYKKKVVIKLHKGVNVIVGPSHSGKSSIVRSLKWLFQNRPQGDRFRNRNLDDKDSVEVGVLIPKDKRLTRQKAPGENIYKVAGIKEPLQALRTDVPTEVSKLSRMKKINIQGQHPTEQYFLLTESPGAVAKAFNKVSGLSIVDKTITVVNKRKRALNGNIKVYDQEIKETEVELADTYWVPEAYKEAQALEKRSKSIEADKKAIKIGSELVDEIEVLDNLLSTRYKDLDKIVEAFDDLDKSREAYNKSAGKMQVLDGVLNSAIDAENKINEYNDIEKALDSLKSTILYREKHINESLTEQEQIQSAIDDITNANTLLKEYEEVLVTAEKEFNKKVKNEACPTCGRKGKV